MADHGTRQSYADGCRCQSCKAAQAQYRREHKARQAGVVTEFPKQGRRPKGAVAPVPVVVSDEPYGPIVAAVEAELATLTSAETRKGAAEAAKALARILQNPNAIGQHVAAAKALPGILEDLRKGSARRKGRLASVQQMTKAATGTDA